MNRHRTHFVALALALLVVGAGIAAAAQTNLAVGSIHTTDADFENSQTRINMSVGGDELTLSNESIIDDFEDGDKNIETANWDGWSGDTASWFSASTSSISGTYSGKLSNSNNFVQVEANATNGHTSDISTEIRIDSQTGNSGDYVRSIIQNDSATGEYIALVRFDHDGTVVVDDGGSDTQIDTWTAGTAYTLKYEFDFDNNQWSVTYDGTTYGPFGLSNGNTADAWGGYNLHSDSSSSGGSFNVFIDDLQEAVSAESGQYVSQNHPVENTEQGFTNVTAADNVSYTVEWREGDGTLLDSATYTTTGNHTQTWSTSSASQVYTNVTVEATGDDPQFELADEGVLFENTHPQIDNGSATPTGDLDSAETDFQIDIADPDFSTSQGDTVTAELVVDNQTVGSDTLTSNGTASVTATISEGGDHEYYWVATDEYGGQTQSQTFDLTTPSELRIYNESQPTQLLTDATVELRFYANETGDATIVERNTSDGTINLTGLPVDQPLVAVADADNYTSRRIFIPSVFEQSSLYLIPDDAQLTTTIFDFEDYSGKFPPEDSALMVQRSLNGSYQTVLGDIFGATGQFPAQLQYNTRHRLILLNAETGEERILGTFTPTGDTTQSVVVAAEGGEDPLDSEPPDVSLQPGARQLPARSDAELALSIAEGADAIDSWSVSATLENETSSTQVWYEDHTGPGETNTTIDLAGHADKLLNVTVTYSVDGTWVTRTYTIRIVEHYDPGRTLLGAIGSLVGQSPAGDARDAFTSFLAMLVTVFMIGGVASIQPSGELAGLVGVFVLGGFAALGWVSYGLVFVAAVGLASFAAIRRGL